MTARFGQNLLEARKRAGLGQAQVAERVTELGVPLRLNSISRLENGSRTANVPELLALALALGVSPNRLLLTSSAADEQVVQLAEGVEPTERQAWRWATGERPLPGDDAEAWQGWQRENRPHEQSSGVKASDAMDAQAQLTPVLRALEEVIRNQVPASLAFLVLRRYEEKRWFSPEVYEKFAPGVLELVRRHEAGEQPEEEDDLEQEDG